MALARKTARWILGRTRTFRRTERWDYAAWISKNEPTAAELDQQRLRAGLLQYRPCVSIVTPVYDVPPRVLRETIESVMAQTYPYWELCLVNAGHPDPALEDVLQEFSDRDTRVRVRRLASNLGIAGNSNEALSMSTGDFVALLDHDDLLAPFALFEVVKYLADHADCDMLYSDEDKIGEDGGRQSCFFKPDWNHDLLRCFMYIGHLTVYRRELVARLGGFRSEYEFSQDYDLALRAEETARHIGHVPQVLYHWRMLRGSAAAGGKPLARASNLAALRASALRRGYDADVIECPCSNHLRFNVSKPEPLVSIVIPTDSRENAFKCLGQLLAKTAYKPYEVIVVTNREVSRQVLRRFSDNARVRTVVWDESFNFSAKCNHGAAEARGSMLLFLNDDVFPLDEDWLGTLIGYLQEEGVGAVSPKMLYENGTIQHAGLVTGVRGFLGTAFHAREASTSEYHGLAQCTRTVSALSAACLLVRKRTFNLIGGFDAVNTPVAHSDFALCFRIREAGLRLVYTPFVTLQHTGHKSIGKTKEMWHRQGRDADLYLLRRWGEYLGYDPYFPPNMRARLHPETPFTYRLHATNNQAVAPKEASVLFVTHDLSMSGAPIGVAELAQALGASYFVTVLSPTDGPARRLFQQRDIPVMIDPDALTTPKNLTHLVEVFDLVIANTVLPWRMVRSAKALGKPVLWLVHESEAGVQFIENNQGAELAMVEADWVVFPSYETTARYQHWSHGGHHATLPVGIPEDPHPSSGDAKRGSRAVRIVQVGTVEPRKGQDVLVAAVQKLTPQVMERCEVFFVGNLEVHPRYSGGLVDTATSLSNVHWVGEVPHEEALDYIADCDILVCTSRDESGPRVVMEAMQRQKAVVCTQVGAAGEVLKHGVNGMLIPQEDADELAAVLAQLVDDPLLRMRLGREAVRTFKEAFTLERYVQDVRAVIRQVLDKGSHGLRATKSRCPNALVDVPSRSDSGSTQV